MYYKIDNKESEVYRKLHSIRAEELKFEEENKQLISEKTGLKWERYLGHYGQQNFNRVSTYSGFEFIQPELVDLKIWKRNHEHNSCFIPNRKFKAGREMANFLNNGLKGHWFNVVFKNLGIERQGGRFVFPYVEIVGETIILFLDDKIEITDENIIEITSKEFNQIREQLETSNQLTTNQ